MQDGSERLDQDVDILETMAYQMAEYLDSEVLFWPMSHGGMPMLTLGGYLMREQRLLALANSLSEELQTQTDMAITRFNQALAERIVRFENKAHNELQARLRQWEEYLKEVERGTAGQSSNFATAVETRAMIAALLDRLSMPPYQTDGRAEKHLKLLDTRLRNNWQPGEFVWPLEWMAAYPENEYWWLYGSPRMKEPNH
ncbi:MAG: hypothetical protein R6X18_16655 [Chloroflexota bacterium]|jgi:hypothetical protein